MFGRRCGLRSKRISGTNPRRRAVAASNGCAGCVVRSTGFAWAKFGCSMMFPARPSRFWRSWPNRRPTHGSHSSQVGNEGSPTVRNQGRLSRFLREAETQEIVITRHGKPAGVLIGFESEEDWFDTVSKMTHASCVVSNRRGTACAQDAGSGWRTSKRNSGIPCALVRLHHRVVLQNGARSG